jgi:hypothetical protein
MSKKTTKKSVKVKVNKEKVSSKNKVKTTDSTGGDRPPNPPKNP